MSGLFDEIERILEAARALPEGEREAYLSRATASDDVRATVRRMLAGVTEGFLAPPLADPAPGRVLGDFELEGEIGRGGMGIVFRARQRSLGRVVALKVLPAHSALTQRRIDRFEREARAAAKLAHPHLVTVHAVGRTDGVRWFAMELVEGRDLEKELVHARTELGVVGRVPARLPSPRPAEWFRWAAELVRQAADGLAFAHTNGIVHRDVKPSNLLVSKSSDGAPHLKLVDFGLARDEELGTLTSLGDFLGTPHYMSPEQARQERHAIDHRTDVYSLGVVLYELLTLRRPFEGKTSKEVLDQVLDRDAPRIRRVQPDVPVELETLCAKAMARDPHARFAHAGELRDELARWLAGEPLTTRAPGPVRRSARWCERRKAPVSLASIALAAGGIGFALPGYLRPDELPTLNVRAVDERGAEVPAEAFVHVIDIETSLPGTARSLGRTPLADEPVPEGVLRLSVAFEDGGVVEVPVHPGLTGSGLDVTVARRAEQESLGADMARIPGGTFVFPEHRLNPYSGRTVEVEPFLLDRTETSNGEYRRYLEATGRPQPWAWREFGYDPRYDALPVVGLNYREVLDYLAWAGKRLPTAAEWMCAALGSEGRAFPYAFEATAEPRGNVGGPSAYDRTVTGRALWERYLALAAPVDSHPEACSPEGVHHLYGNVLEWTESVLCLHVDGELVPNPLARLHFGGAWDADPSALRAPGYEEISTEHGLLMLGFRGARSLPP